MSGDVEIEATRLRIIQARAEERERWAAWHDRRATQLEAEEDALPQHECAGIEPSMHRLTATALRTNRGPA